MQLLPEKQLLFWRLWFCNYIYAKYNKTIKKELIDKQGILSDGQLTLLKEILENSWKIYDRDKEFDKKKLEDYNKELAKINVEDLDLLETIDCAVSELIFGLNNLLTSFTEDIRGNEVLISQSTINILDTELDAIGLDILDPDVFKRAEVQREVHGQIEMLDVLLDKKLNGQLTSESRNIFREDLDNT